MCGSGCWWVNYDHYNDVIVITMASPITSLTIVYSIVYSDADQRKHQISVSLALVRGIHQGPVNSSHKWPVTRKMFPFDDVIMWKQHIIIQPAHTYELTSSVWAECHNPRCHALLLTTRKYHTDVPPYKVGKTPNKKTWILLESFYFNAMYHSSTRI